VDYLFLSETIEMLGHLLIAYTVIMVHYRFRKEHKVDMKVFREMRREQIIGVTGVIFLLAGYFVKIIFIL